MIDNGVVVGVFIDAPMAAPLAAPILWKRQRAIAMIHIDISGGGKVLPSR